MSDSSDPATSYSLETIYSSLEDRRRRLVLHYLQSTADGVAELEELCRRLGRWESSAAGTEGDSQRELAASLHHVHLPKLVEYGIVDYDWRTNVVRYRPGDTLESHLELAADRDFDDSSDR